MCLLVLCLMPGNLLDPNASFASFSGRLTISPVVERLVFSKVGSAPVLWEVKGLDLVLGLAIGLVPFRLSQFSPLDEVG